MTFRKPLENLFFKVRPPDTWITQNNIALRSGPQPKPFNQTNWPLTPAVRQPNTWITQSNIALGSAPIVLLPCLVSNWGDVDQQPYIMAELRRNATLLTGPPPQRPFNQTNWPLTPAARQPDRTWQRAFPPELIGQDRLPFRQQSWPVPRAHLEFHTLRSITPGRVIYGGEVAPIPPEPEPPPPPIIHSVRAFAEAYYGIADLEAAN